MATIIKAHFRLNNRDLLRSRGLEKGGRVQQAIDNAVIRLCEDYCPIDTGTLSKSPYSASTPGRVVYDRPYARYLYYGEVWGPNIPVFDDDSGEPAGFFSPKDQKKHPTGRQIDYSKSQARGKPLAGSFWFERMKADHAKDIIKEAESVARGK